MRKRKSASQHYRQYCQSELSVARKGSESRQAKFKVVGCMMNATGGKSASGVIWYTQCKEHGEGERFMSASPGCKDVD